MRSILDAVGNTPLVELQKIRPHSRARICLKLESANPTGSMKDRMALEAMRAASADGRLRPGDTVVEYTAGTTGISLAFVCAAMGYRFHAVFSDAFSHEKRITMKAMGTVITDIKSDGGRITEQLIKAMIDRAAEISAEPGHWYADQLTNEDGARGYEPLGEEIWAQTEGRVETFVQAVGTAHSITGASAALRRRSPSIRVFAVEPAESAVLSGQPTGSHRIEGIGIGFVPPLWNPSIVEGIERVASEEAHVMARRLANEEGIFAGSSTAANVIASLRIAETMPADSIVVTVAVDSGLRYVSTRPYVDLA
jgi:cysteine synthase A